MSDVASDTFSTVSQYETDSSNSASGQFTMQQQTTLPEVSTTIDIEIIRVSASEGTQPENAAAPSTPKPDTSALEKKPESASADQEIAPKTVTFAETVKVVVLDDKSLSLSDDKKPKEPQEIPLKTIDGRAPKEPQQPASAASTTEQKQVSSTQESRQTSTTTSQSEVKNEVMSTEQKPASSIQESNQTTTSQTEIKTEISSTDQKSFESTTNAQEVKQSESASEQKSTESSFQQQQSQVDSSKLSEPTTIGSKPGISPISVNMCVDESQNQNDENVDILVMQREKMPEEKKPGPAVDQSKSEISQEPTMPSITSTEVKTEFLGSSENKIEISPIEAKINGTTVSNTDSQFAPLTIDTASSTQPTDDSNLRGLDAYTAFAESSTSLDFSAFKPNASLEVAKSQFSPGSRTTDMPQDSYGSATFVRPTGISRQFDDESESISKEETSINLAATDSGVTQPEAKIGDSSVKVDGSLSLATDSTLTDTDSSLLRGLDAYTHLAGTSTSIDFSALKADTIFVESSQTQSIPESVKASESTTIDASSMKGIDAFTALAETSTSLDFSGSKQDSSADASQPVSNNLINEKQEDSSALRGIDAFTSLAETSTSLDFSSLKQESTADATTQPQGGAEPMKANELDQPSSDNLINEQKTDSTQLRGIDAFTSLAETSTSLDFSSLRQDSASDTTQAQASKDDVEIPVVHLENEGTNQTTEIEKQLEGLISNEQSKTDSSLDAPKSDISISPIEVNMSSVGVTEERKTEISSFESNSQNLGSSIDQKLDVPTNELKTDATSISTDKAPEILIGEKKPESIPEIKTEIFGLSSEEKKTETSVGTTQVDESSRLRSEALLSPAESGSEVSTPEEKPREPWPWEKKSMFTNLYDVDKFHDSFSLEKKAEETKTSESKTEATPVEVKSETAAEKPLDSGFDSKPLDSVLENKSSDIPSAEIKNETATDKSQEIQQADQKPLDFGLELKPVDSAPETKADATPIEFKSEVTTDKPQEIQPVDQKSLDSGVEPKPFDSTQEIKTEITSTEVKNEIFTDKPQDTISTEQKPFDSGIDAKPFDSIPETEIDITPVETRNEVSTDKPQELPSTDQKPTDSGLESKPFGTTTTDGSIEISPIQVSRSLLSDNSSNILVTDLKTTFTPADSKSSDDRPESQNDFTSLEVRRDFQREMAVSPIERVSPIPDNLKSDVIDDYNERRKTSIAAEALRNARELEALIAEANEEIIAASPTPSSIDISQADSTLPKTELPKLDQEPKKSEYDLPTIDPKMPKLERNWSEDDDYEYKSKALDTSRLPSINEPSSLQLTDAKTESSAMPSTLDDEKPKIDEQSSQITDSSPLKCADDFKTQLETTSSIDFSSSKQESSIETSQFKSELDQPKTDSAKDLPETTNSLDFSSVKQESSTEVEPIKTENDLPKIDGAQISDASSLRGIDALTSLAETSTSLDFSSIKQESTIDVEPTKNEIDQQKPSDSSSLRGIDAFASLAETSTSLDFSSVKQESSIEVEPVKTEINGAPNTQDSGNNSLRGIDASTSLAELAELSTKLDFSSIKNDTTFDALQSQFQNGDMATEIPVVHLGNEEASQSEEISKQLGGLLGSDQPKTDENQITSAISSTLSSANQPTQQIPDDSSSSKPNELFAPQPSSNIMTDSGISLQDQPSSAFDMPKLEGEQSQPKINEDSSPRTDSLQQSPIDNPAGSIVSEAISSVDFQSSKPESQVSADTTNQVASSEIEKQPEVQSIQTSSDNVTTVTVDDKPIDSGKESGSFVTQIPVEQYGSTQTPSETKIDEEQRKIDQEPIKTDLPKDTTTSSLPDSTNVTAEQKVDIEVIKVPAESAKTDSSMQPTSDTTINLPLQPETNLSKEAGSLLDSIFATGEKKFESEQAKNDRFTDDSSQMETDTSLAESVSISTEPNKLGDELAKNEPEPTKNDLFTPTVSSLTNNDESQSRLSEQKIDSESQKIDLDFNRTDSTTQPTSTFTSSEVPQSKVEEPILACELTRKPDEITTTEPPKIEPEPTKIDNLVQSISNYISNATSRDEENQMKDGASSLPETASTVTEQKTESEQPKVEQEPTKIDSIPQDSSNSISQDSLWNANLPEATVSLDFQGSKPETQVVIDSGDKSQAPSFGYANEGGNQSKEISKQLGSLVDKEPSQDYKDSFSTASSDANRMTDGEKPIDCTYNIEKFSKPESLEESTMVMADSGAGNQSLDIATKPTDSFSQSQPVFEEKKPEPEPSKPAETPSSTSVEPTSSDTITWIRDLEPKQDEGQRKIEDTPIFTTVQDFQSAVVRSEPDKTPSETSNNAQFETKVTEPEKPSSFNQFPAQPAPDDDGIVWIREPPPNEAAADSSRPDKHVHFNDSPVIHPPPSSPGAAASSGGPAVVEQKPPEFDSGSQVAGLSNGTIQSGKTSEAQKDSLPQILMSPPEEKPHDAENIPPNSQSILGGKSTSGDDLSMASSVPDSIDLSEIERAMEKSMNDTKNLLGEIGAKSNELREKNEDLARRIAEERRHLMGENQQSEIKTITDFEQLPPPPTLPTGG
ncbi:hypothetical protein WR25_10971 isoform D [Diploscapter pachys]|nr:hypothetical protein WR25_10971 isoform B [Diploscapter pachys]PAV91159.1 hypothetical protein WR25_10971 isoform C [Diploscapter pachys]PAV91160.1 hypothetical protein WR25_10971 isoform D [Diploscapter pachys]